MAFYLKFEHRQADGSYRDLYPDLVRGLSRGQRAPKPGWNPRCPNKVRYEMLTRLGYFVTESSEHFAGIHALLHQGRPRGPDREVRHPARRVSEALHRADRALEHRRRRSTARPTRIEVKQSKEYASAIVNAAWTGEPDVIYGNVRNNGLITSLPEGCRRRGARASSTASGIQPTLIGDAAAAARRR